MRAMPVAIAGAITIIDQAVAWQYASGKLRMVGTDAGVDDKCRHAGARVLKCILRIERPVCLVDAVQAPCGLRLYRHRLVQLY